MQTAGFVSKLRSRLAFNPQHDYVEIDGRLAWKRKSGSIVHHWTDSKGKKHKGPELLAYDQTGKRFLTVTSALKSGRPTKQVILFLHGNSWSLGLLHGRYPYDSSAAWDCSFIDRLARETGCDVVAFDYAGYNPDDGAPHYILALQNAWTVYQLLRKKYRADQIVIFGYSIGTAISTWLASQAPSAGLILQSSFSSFRDLTPDAIAERRRGMVRSLFRPINFYKSDKLIAALKCKVYFIHGDQDDLCPLQRAANMCKAAGKKCIGFQVAVGKNHSTVPSDPYFFVAINDALSKFSKN